MCTDVERWVVEDLLLNQLLLLVLAHLPLQEMERRVGLLHLYWSALAFLLVEDGTQIPIFTIVFAAVHSE